MITLMHSRHIGTEESVARINMREIRVERSEFRILGVLEEDERKREAELGHWQGCSINIIILYGHNKGQFGHKLE